MILVGSQRGGAGKLAAHLLNDRDNDHVELMELRGFMSSDLHGALAEAHAISKATRCTQFMFSLSLNPPRDEHVSIEKLVDAADRAEEALGLKGQPRAIVVHEKNARRHIHVVWSRIDVAEMKAINLPHFKNRLRDLSKDLYLEHGWELPGGHRENGWKNPLNFTLAEWQQCKRLDLDPREVKQLFQEAWARSDNLTGFDAALKERGYFLAAGDRRGFVAVDLQGEVFSISRMAGVKTKDLETRLGSPGKLPGVEAVRAANRQRVTELVHRHLSEAREEQRARLKPLKEERERMVKAQRIERARLNEGQEERRVAENAARQDRLRRGLGGVMDILTGRAAQVRAQNDHEAFEAYRRDRAQRETLFEVQMRERRDLQRRLDFEMKFQRERLRGLVRDLSRVRTPQPNAPVRMAPQRRRDGLEFDR